MVKLQQSYGLYYILFEVFFGLRTAFPYIHMDTKKSDFISEVVS